MYLYKITLTNGIKIKFAITAIAENSPKKTASPQSNHTLPCRTSMCFGWHQYSLWHAKIRSQWPGRFHRHSVTWWDNPRFTPPRYEKTAADAGSCRYLKSKDSPGVPQNGYFSPLCGAGSSVHGHSRNSAGGNPHRCAAPAICPNRRGGTFSWSKYHANEYP